VKRLAQGQYETDAHFHDFGFWHIAINCSPVAESANKDTFRDPITKFTDGKTSEEKNIKEKMCCVMQMPIPKCGTLGIMF
jgi:hypothetical protein